jgi:CRP-like cAMP-binding protein
MKREEVWQLVADSLRDPFGRLLEVRDVRRVRRVAGDAWTVTVVLAKPSGDLHVADVSVDDTGKISPKLTADDVVAAARNAQQAASLAPPPDELSDFGDFGEDDGPASDPALAMLTEMEEPIEVRAAAALEKGDPKSLHEARELLPRLLSEHEKQGQTLFMMAQVEHKLGETSLARGYLEASAREFADRFDMPALDKAAALALELEGRDSFSGSPIHTLLEQSRARLKPIDAGFSARSFKGLNPEVREKLNEHIELRTLAPGDTLVSEGDPSRNVFVVKSGLIGVWLEKPSGGQWLVRCCFPGWLLGESSVLGDPNTAKCTASLRAERVSEVWIVPAEHMRSAMLLDQQFGRRIGITKQMHRIDSFFSMHETMGQLDVQVRDEMLSCIQRLETFETETVLLEANEVPDVALLVARGSLALYEGEKEDPIASIPPDCFYGVRDAIHRIAPSVSAVARAGTTVAFFDAKRLQKLCERSPEQVAAVLERLG